MKCFINILLIVVGVVNLCKGQDTIKVNVPLLKESEKVDSLICAVVNQNKTYSVARTDDSCFLLCLSEGDKLNFVQGIKASIKKNEVFDYANFSKNKNLGFFEFNGYLVFVYGEPFVNKLFRHDTSTKAFNFFKDNISTEFYMIQHYISWAVFYRDGKLNYGVH